TESAIKLGACGFLPSGMAGVPLTAKRFRRSAEATLAIEGARLPPGQSRSAGSAGASPSRGERRSRLIPSNKHTAAEGGIECKELSQKGAIRDLSIRQPIVQHRAVHDLELLPRSRPTL